MSLCTVKWLEARNAGDTYQATLMFIAETAGAALSADGGGGMNVDEVKQFVGLPFCTVTCLNAQHGMAEFLRIGV